MRLLSLDLALLNLARILVSISSALVSVAVAAAAPGARRRKRPPNVTANRVSLSPMRRFRMFSEDSYASLDFVKNYGLIVRKGPQWDERRGSLAGLDAEALAKAQSDMLESGLLEVEELQGSVGFRGHG